MRLRISNFRIMETLGLMKTEKRKTSGLGILLMLVCAGCLCTGQFIWKSYDGPLPLIVGFGIYGLGAFSMLCAYRFGSLSVLQPINSVSYVIAAVLGNIFFDEAITVGKIAGITLIMAGVIFLARGEIVE
jgi:uncharacterized membrane protein